MQSGKNASFTLKLVGAFAIIYVVWGSTYLAIRFAIDSLPPFLMAGGRYLIAGAVLSLIVRNRSDERLSLSNLRAAFIIGTLMLLGGNGLVCWAEQSVPSGVAALLIATVPIWMVMLDWLICRGPRPGIATMIGLILGLTGIYVLVGADSFKSEPIDRWGAIALLSACVFWTLGSLYSRRAALPKSTLLATGFEMIGGGLSLLIVGTLNGEWMLIRPESITLKSCLALAYLIVFGSIIALPAYKWLLTVCPPGRAATYAYVNPVIAVSLGAMLAGEALSLRVILACSVIVIAVVIITRSSVRRSPAFEPPPAESPADETQTVVGDAIT
ncbi:MAG: EamA family transporter [Phycisphaerales bacterium]|nr:EamA family transporter [Phycisphaerales bacterium]MCB9855655.1 EamA family transporter [Phycisphaerales bacterium]MCB9862551.1 EamA family transporter [Phycisphaerales bacterium]